MGIEKEIAYLIPRGKRACPGVCYRKTRAEIETANLENEKKLKLRDIVDLDSLGPSYSDQNSMSSPPHTDQGPDIKVYKDGAQQPICASLRGTECHKITYRNHSLLKNGLCPFFKS